MRTSTVLLALCCIAVALTGASAQGGNQNNNNGPPSGGPPSFAGSSSGMPPSGPPNNNGTLPPNGGGNPPPFNGTSGGQFPPPSFNGTGSGPNGGNPPPTNGTNGSGPNGGNSGPNGNPHSPPQHHGDGIVRNVTLDDLLNGTISLPVNGTTLRLEEQICKDRLQQLKLEHDDSSASVDGGSTIQVPLLNSSCANGQLLVGNSATLHVDRFLVGAAADVTVVLSKSASTQSTVTMDSLDLSGDLNIDGDSTTTVSFPSKATSVKVNADGQVNVGGGVGLSGDASNAPINIGAASGSNVSLANILRNASFHHSGAITGDAGSVLGIQGEFDYNGTSISPELQISTGAVVHFEVVAGIPVHAGNLSFPHQNNGNSNCTIFQINATSADAGKDIAFGTVKNCPAEVTIKYHIEGTAKRAAALSAGVTVMTYAKASVEVRANFSCTIQVCDDDGCTDVTPSTNATATTSRRLFKTSSKVASFGETSLTVQADSTTDDGSGVSSASAVSVVSALLVSILGAMFFM